MIAGALGALGATLVLPKQDLYDAATIGVQITGIWNATQAFEGTVDGLTWFAVLAVDAGGSGTSATSTTANGSWRVDGSGLAGFRLRSSAWVSGSAQATVQGSVGYSV